MICILFGTIYARAKTVLIIKSGRKYSTDNILRQIWPIEIALSTDTPTSYDTKGGFFVFHREELNSLKTRRRLINDTNLKN